MAPCFKQTVDIRKGILDALGMVLPVSIKNLLRDPPSIPFFHYRPCGLILVVRVTLDQKQEEIQFFAHVIHLADKRSFSDRR